MAAYESCAGPRVCITRRPFFFGRFPVRPCLYLLVAYLSIGSALPQAPSRISSVAPLEATAGEPVTVKADLIQGETIQRVYFLHRAFGEREFRSMEMDLFGNTASATVPEQFAEPPFLEYYLVLVGRDGFLETHPAGNSPDPFTTPPFVTGRINIRSEDESERQILFLSPEPFAVLPVDDLVISVSVYRADSAVIRRATRILIDGVDVTAEVIVDGDIMVFTPALSSRTLRAGNHRVTVELFTREGTLHRSASLPFTLLREGLEPGMPINASPWNYAATAQFESRYEELGLAVTRYNRGSLTGSARRGDWNFLGSAFITSDEERDRQPQNRFLLGVESEWLALRYGDSYPVFPSLVLSGKRVRGIHGALHLGAFNLDLSYGDVMRSVEGALLGTIHQDSIAIEQGRDPSAAYGKIDSLTWGKYSYGTYQRSILAVRPSFGSGEDDQFGITFMKSRDELSSIRYGIRPQENVVIGADFIARFDNRRIELAGQAAFSAYNSDISSGSFTDAYIDSVFPNQKDEVKKVVALLDGVITVNENLHPLSLERLATAAYEASIGLKYFDNDFTLSYVLRGSDYNSFGQTFLRTDIRGFSIGDRFRVDRNRMFLNVHYEHLSDNNGQTKVATTDYTTFTMSSSYYSFGMLPDMTVGYAYYRSLNPLDNIGLDSLLAVNDRTHRIFLQSGYDFTAGAKHSAMMNLSWSDRDDRTVRRLNVRSSLILLGISSQFTFPLQTAVETAFYFNTIPGPDSTSQSTELDYTTLVFAGRYTFDAGRYVAFGSFSPTLGDYRRTVMTVGMEFIPAPALPIRFEYSYLHNAGLPNDKVVTLRLRYEI